MNVVPSRDQRERLQIRNRQRRDQAALAPRERLQIRNRQRRDQAALAPRERLQRSTEWSTRPLRRATAWTKCLVCLAVLVAVTPLRSQDKPTQSAATQNTAAKAGQGASPSPTATAAGAHAASSLEIHDPGVQVPDDLTPQLLSIKRVFVDRLTGGETAARSLVGSQ
jgi:hypothetical protein